MATIVNDGILLEYIVGTRYLHLNELIEISKRKCSVFVEILLWKGSVDKPAMEIQNYAFPLPWFLFQTGNTESPWKSLINRAKSESCGQKANGESPVS